jgi:phosphohistidine phosphatase
MRLLLIRHAIAMPHGTPGISDDERPLTADGERRFRQAARGLTRIMKRPDVLLTSPLPRAVQTAEVAAAAWGKIKPQEAPPLATGNFDGLAALLAELPAEARVAAVGHEPHLSALLARLLGSGHEDRFTFRKGGVALVELDGPLSKGGQLLWFLPPRILRELAD